MQRIVICVILRWLCRNILQKQVCKFGSACSFEHLLIHEYSLDEGASVETLTKEMEKLICLLKHKDDQIKNLELKIKQIEGETVFDKIDSDLDTVSDSSSIDADNSINEFMIEELYDDSRENESHPPYECEKCDFKIINTFESISMWKQFSKILKRNKMSSLIWRVKSIEQIEPAL